MNPQISAFEPKGRNQQRIVVWLDGEPWQELDAETVVRERLKKTMPLDAAAQTRVLATDAAIRARKAAAGYAARGPRTRREMETYLERRGFGPEAREAALTTLTESGTLDEERAVAQTIRKRRRSGQGPRRIEAELRARGADAAPIRRQLDRALEGADLAAECLALARKGAARYAPLTEPAQRRKLTQSLLRRGFEGDDVRRAVETVCREQAVPLDDGELDG